MGERGQPSTNWWCCHWQRDLKSDTQLVSVRHVPKYPLIVSIGVSENGALALWRDRASFIAAGTILATICLIVLLVAVSSRVRLLKASQQTLVRQKEELAVTSAELATAKAQTDAAVDNITQGITMFDMQQRLILCNTRFRELYDLSANETEPGTTFQKILSCRRSRGNHISDPHRPITHSATKVLQGEKLVKVVTLADGRVISVVSNPTVSGGWVTTHEDITERHRAEAKITYMATHDTLTGLPNRAAFEQAVSTASDQLESAGQPFSLILFDLDHFKQVNDTLGHQAGDTLLKAVANRALSCIGEDDMLARLGGDEFVILQSGFHDRSETARQVANRLLDAMERSVEIASADVHVGVSMGIAVAPHDGTTKDTLLKNADLALYRAKEQGRNRFRFHEPSVDGAVGRRLHASGTRYNRRSARGWLSACLSVCYATHSVRCFKNLRRLENAVVTRNIGWLAQNIT